MAKRWFICPVVGTGTSDDPWRAKAHDLNVNCTAVIPSNPDGSPQFNWCLVKVAAIDFTALAADGTIDAWPNVSLDTTVNQLPAAVRNRLKTALTNRGIDTSDLTGATPLRLILRRIGRSMQSSFHEDLVDIVDVG